MLRDSKVISTMSDSNGDGNYSFLNDKLYLNGDYSVIGRYSVLHKKRNDLGMAGTNESLTNGNSGARISCEAIVNTSKVSVPFDSNSFSASTSTAKSAYAIINAISQMSRTKQPEASMCTLLPR